MRLPTLLSYSARALIAHRQRSLLSLLGMTIGVAAVILLTALGDGARVYVTEQFSDLGTNLVIVVPGKNETTGTVPGVSGVANDLTLDDAVAIGRRIPQIKRVAPVSVGTETVAYGPRRRQVAVFGTNNAYFSVLGVPIRLGEALPDLELSRSAPVVVLGHETAKELFGAVNPVGKAVRVGDLRVRVIGVMGSKGMQLGVDRDDMAVVPVATAMRLFNRSSLFRVLVETHRSNQLEEVRESIEDLIRERHGEDDVTILTQDAVVSTFSAIFRALTLALAAIGAISLTVAGVGIMNVMLVSVAERTAEVGLLRALGAARAQILWVFLIEAALLSAVGGAIGLGLGLAASWVLRWVYPAFPAFAPIWAIGAALGIAVGAGLIFGVLPARKATLLDPVEALR